MKKDETMTEAHGVLPSPLTSVYLLRQTEVDGMTRFSYLVCTSAVDRYLFDDSCLEANEELAMDIIQFFADRKDLISAPDTEQIFESSTVYSEFFSSEDGSLLAEKLAALMTFLPTFSSYDHVLEVIESEGFTVEKTVEGSFFQR